MQISARKSWECSSCFSLQMLSTFQDPLFSKTNVSNCVIRNRDALTQRFSPVSLWLQLDNMLSKILFQYQVLVLTNLEVRKKIYINIARVSFIHSILLYCYNLNKFRNLGCFWLLEYKTHCKPTGKREEIPDF